MNIFEANPESFYQGMTEPEQGVCSESQNSKAPREIDTSGITDIEFEDIDPLDYPDFCDAFISSAKMHSWQMTSEELDDLNENYGEWVYEKVIESIF
jgi:hypothetical protein